MPRDHLFIVFGNAIAKTVPVEECRRCLSRYVQENTLSREESNLVMKWQCRKEMAKKRRGAILKHGHKFFHTLLAPLESGKAYNCFDPKQWKYKGMTHVSSMLGQVAPSLFAETLAFECLSHCLLP